MFMLMLVLVLGWVALCITPRYDAIVDRRIVNCNINCLTVVSNPCFELHGETDGRTVEGSYRKIVHTPRGIHPKPSAVNTTVLVCVPEASTKLFETVKQVISDDTQIRISIKIEL